MVNSAAAHDAAAPPARRLVLLGASNLARGVVSAVDAARAVWGEPLDVMAALGHGRSYGRKSCVLGRSLTGVAQCALWDELAARPRLPTAAVVTDVGNDILYGVSNKKILDWVARCLSRLASADARVVLTGLPIASLAALQR
ncbi:MAG: hypothetical protein KDA41_05970, partial [Planctomycetales bacterium]|nr:hypothetical protein [Planctomycetales bacterium]